LVLMRVARDMFGPRRCTFIRGFCSLKIEPTHPQIDMRPVFDSTHPDRPEALRAMERAMRDAGYFYAANMPGLDVEYMQNVYTLSTAAHALPLDVKRQFVHPHGTYSGQYRRLHPERVDCQVASIRLRRRRGRGTRRARVRERHHLGGSRVGLLTHALYRQGALPQQPAPDHRCYGLRHTRRAQRFVWESKTAI
jgi:hypothetical protein